MEVLLISIGTISGQQRQPGTHNNKYSVHLCQQVLILASRCTCNTCMYIVDVIHVLACRCVLGVFLVVKLFEFSCTFVGSCVATKFFYRQIVGYGKGVGHHRVS